MAKKKKKKAVKKKNLSSNKKKKNTSKKKSTASKTNRNISSKSGAKKVSSNTSVSKKTNVKKSSVKNSTVDKNIKNTKNIKNSSNKKKIKVNKKVLVVSFVILILGIFGLVLLTNNINNRVSSDGFIKINFDDYLDLYEKDELEFVYLYHSSCINCDSYEEKLINLEKEFGIKLKKFDYSKLNDSDLSILKSSNSFLQNGIEIPMIISIKGSNEISSVSGIKEYSALKNFVNLSKKENGGNKFTKIDVNDYLSIMSSKEKNLIYICDSSESCNKFTSVLDKVGSDRKLKVNYLNTENIVSSDDWDKLEASDKIFDAMWFMPVIMVVKDGKIIDYKMETLSESDLNKFLKKNGM